MKATWIVLLGVAALGWLACEDKPSGDAPTAAGETAPAAEAEAGLVEEHAEGRVEWVVRPNGDVVASLRSLKDESIAASEASGKLRVEGEDFSLTEEANRLVGNVRALEDGLTDIEYELTVRGSSWKGTLQVPREGTAALLKVPAKPPSSDARGPNGGMIEVVGDQRVEILFDEESGEVRVYLLDENDQPIDVGDSELTIGIVEEK